MGGASSRSFAASVSVVLVCISLSASASLSVLVVCRESLGCLLSISRSVSLFISFAVCCVVSVG